MKKLAIFIIFFFSKYNCFAQAQYDYVLCNYVKISIEHPPKYLTICAVTDKSLYNTFGNPETVEKNELEDYKLYVYQGANFTIGAGGDSFVIRSKKYIMSINDTIRFSVGDDVGCIFKYFPKSASNIKEYKNGIQMLNLYNCSENELDKVEQCSSRIRVLFSPSTHKISGIEKFDLN